MGGLILCEVAPAFAQAQVAIHGSADHVGVAIILPIVLPPAHLAQLKGIRQGKRFVATAKTADGDGCSHPLSMRRI
jgi:hypothetical protein